MQWQVSEACRAGKISACCQAIFIHQAYSGNVRGHSQAKVDMPPLWASHPLCCDCRGSVVSTAGGKACCSSKARLSGPRDGVLRGESLMLRTIGDMHQECSASMNACARIVQ